MPETCGPNQGCSFFNHTAHLEQIGKYVDSRYEEDVLIWLQRGCGGGDMKGEGKAEALAHFGLLVFQVLVLAISCARLLWFEQ